MKSNGMFTLIYNAGLARRGPNCHARRYYSEQADFC